MLDGCEGSSFINTRTEWLVFLIIKFIPSLSSISASSGIKYGFYCPESGIENI